MFACTEEHFHDPDFPCPHEFKMFYGMLRDRRGHFTEAMWVCEQCLHRVNNPNAPRTNERDIPLFELEEA